MELHYPQSDPALDVQRIAQAAALRKPPIPTPDQGIESGQDPSVDRHRLIAKFDFYKKNYSFYSISSTA